MKQLETKETPGTVPLTHADARESDGTEPNQPPPFEGRNLYLTDRALRNAADRASCVTQGKGAQKGKWRLPAIIDLPLAISLPPYSAGASGSTHPPEPCR